jgi:RNA polymerase sigma-70 factor (ECF subfamily)
LEQLVPLIDTPLRRAARHYLNGRLGRAALQTASLVNETYLRLIARGPTDWNDRRHFFALSAKIMRGILVDHVRARSSGKRGGQFCVATLDEDALHVSRQRADLIAIDDALKTLIKFDPRKAQVVELRFFGGYSVEEAAQILDVSPETIKREWRLAKIWLVRELKGP